MSPTRIESFVFALIFLALLLNLLRWYFRRGNQRKHFARCTGIVRVQPMLAAAHKKPDWVIAEVLRLKVLMGKHAGCRKVAQTFNRLHGPLVLLCHSFQVTLQPRKWSRGLRDQCKRQKSLSATLGIWARYFQM
jgi:hypothetical protein